MEWHCHCCLFVSQWQTWVFLDDSGVRNSKLLALMPNPFSKTQCNCWKSEERTFCKASNRSAMVGLLKLYFWSHKTETEKRKRCMQLVDRDQEAINVDVRRKRHPPRRRRMPNGCQVVETLWVHRPSIVARICIRKWFCGKKNWRLSVLNPFAKPKVVYPRMMSKCWRKSLRKGTVSIIELYNWSFNINT